MKKNLAKEILDYRYKSSIYINALNESSYFSINDKNKKEKILKEVIALTEQIYFGKTKKPEHYSTPVQLNEGGLAELLKLLKIGKAGSRAAEETIKAAEAMKAREGIFREPAKTIQPPAEGIPPIQVSGTPAPKPPEMLARPVDQPQISERAMSKIRQQLFAGYSQKAAKLAKTHEGEALEYEILKQLKQDPMYSELFSVQHPEIEKMGNVEYWRKPGEFLRSSAGSPEAFGISDPAEFGLTSKERLLPVEPTAGERLATRQEAIAKLKSKQSEMEKLKIVLQNRGMVGEEESLSKSLDDIKKQLEILEPEAGEIEADIIIKRGKAKRTKGGEVSKKVDELETGTSEPQSTTKETKTSVEIIPVEGEVVDKSALSRPVKKVEQSQADLAKKKPTEIDTKKVEQSQSDLAIKKPTEIRREEGKKSTEIRREEGKKGDEGGGKDGEGKGDEGKKEEGKKEEGKNEGGKTARGGIPLPSDFGGYDGGGSIIDDHMRNLKTQADINAYIDRFYNIAQTIRVQ